MFYYLDIFLMLIEEPFFYDKKIEKPIFIFGYPRSATTGVHETFYKAAEISSITLADVLFKSKISKQIFKIEFVKNFISKLLEKYQSKGHKVSLESLSEEHLLLFNHFIYFAIPNLYKAVSKKIMDNQKIVLKNDISFIKRVIQRLDNKRYMGKLLFLDGNYDILKEVFPGMINIHCKRNLKESFISYIILGYHLSNKQISFDEKLFERYIDNHYMLFRQIELNLKDISYVYTIEFDNWCKDQKTEIINCAKSINLNINNNFDIYKDGKSDNIPENLMDVLNKKLTDLSKRYE